MLLSDVIIGTILGAILWPIIQKVVDATTRAVLGLILGGIVGGALSWARIGLYAGLIIGAALGANVEPIETDLGLAFLEALYQTASGAAIGAVVALSIQSISFVIVGGGIGLIASLFLSGGLRLLNQTLLTNPLPGYQITFVVILGIVATFAFLSGRR